MKASQIAKLQKQVATQRRIVKQEENKKAQKAAYEEANRTRDMVISVTAPWVEHSRTEPITMRYVDTLCNAEKLNGATIFFSPSMDENYENEVEDFYDARIHCGLVGTEFLIITLYDICITSSKFPAADGTDVEIAFGDRKFIAKVIS